MAYSVQYIYKVIDKYTVPLARIQRKTKAFERQMMVTNAALRAFDTTVLKTKKSINSYTSSLNKTNAKNIAFGQAVNQAAEKANRLADKEDKLKRKTDEATRSIGRINAKLLTFDKRLQDTKRRIADSGFGRLSKQMQGVGRTLTARVTLPLAIAGGVAIKTAIDMESAWTGVLKTVEAPRKVLSKLNEELKEMATVTPLAVNEIFGIAEAAGQLDVKAKDIAAFTRVMIDLSETTNITAREGAMEFAKFSNVVGVAVKDYRRLGSVIVDLGNNMATTEAEILAMASRLKTAGKLAGLSAPNILSISAALTSIGIEAQAGGTAFSQTMIRISNAVATNSDKVKLFAYVTGKSVQEFTKLWKEDAAEGLLQFTEGLAKVEEGVIRFRGKAMPASAVLDKLGMDGIRMSIALLGAAASGDTFRKAIERGDEAWRENLALTKEAALRYGTAASKLKMFKNRLVIMFAAFGDILTPVVIKITELLVPIIDWLKKLSPATKKVIIVIGAMAAALGPLLLSAAGIIASFAILKIVISGIIASFLIFKSVAVAVAIALAPFWAIIAAITFAFLSIGAAVYQTIKHWKAITYEFRLFKEAVDNFFTGGAFDLFLEALGNVKESLKFIYETLMSIGKIKGAAKVLMTPAPEKRTAAEAWKSEVEFSIAKRKLAETESPMAGRMTAMKGTLNGTIGIRAEPGTTITEAEMETDMPGNLGFNMGF